MRTMDEDIAVLKERLLLAEADLEAAKKHLRECRQQNEYMLAGLRAMYEKVRSDQFGNRVQLPDRIVRGRT